ncbi:MAG TPA: histidinol dehydrogenase [Steroidobacteraceae bacterium]|jgi:histidinol dehydrogenase|nr:histidinol dehydrogenase [Steroidobacteraceae bacterium]
MQILHWTQLNAAQRRAALARPAIEGRAEVAADVARLISQVRAEGDVALLELTWRFDGVRLDALAVSAAEFAAARSQLTPVQIAALERAIGNIEKFHAAQQLPPLSLETSPGVRCERITRAIGAVGLYVPAGSAPLPSAVIMLAVPARLAGCPRRVLCTPPARDGGANAAVLVAAQLCGIDTVFKVGGAQAIAALAYGTGSIPKVDKIFGPGNAWVTAAKQQVAADPEGAAVDLPAGPSEVLVIADETARPEFVASDLLAQAEHDPQSQAILVTPSAQLAAVVAAQVQRQMATLSRHAILVKSIAASRCIVVPDLATAIEVCNEYAPEHLLLQIRQARDSLDLIRNAGSIFLGDWSPEPMGDYCSGTNHVLPTYGYARAYSGLSLSDFSKRITVQELTPAGLRDLGPVAAAMANLEGLDAHAAAVQRRLAVLEQGL